MGVYLFKPNPLLLLSGPPDLMEFKQKKIGMGVFVTCFLLIYESRLTKDTPVGKENEKSLIVFQQRQWPAIFGH